MFFAGAAAAWFLLAEGVMTLAPLTSGRPRCPAHGLLVDDRGACARCARAADAVAGRRSLAALFVYAGLALVGLVLVGGALQGFRFLEERRAARAAAAADVSGRAKQLVVYTTKTCPACRMARSYLQSHDIPYVERDVGTPEAEAEFRALGSGRGVPTFVADGEVWSGFDPQGIILRRTLAKHGML